MVTNEQKFFRKRKDAAFVKHAILAGYLKPYAIKVGVHADHVVFIDGYAGPGVYDEGDPGSPEIALSVGEAVADHRALRGHFIEQKRAFVDTLRGRLDEREAKGWKVHHGTAEEHLPAVLADAANRPVLLFLDPYGLAVPFDQLVGQVMARTTITEVVVNFSLAALKRLGGFLDKDYAGRTEAGPEDLFGNRRPPDMTEEQAEVASRKRDSVVASMDAFLGGVWWRDVKRSGRPTWREEVRKEWVERLCREAGPAWKHWTVPIPEKLDGDPVYDLVLFSRHHHGLWLFNDSASRAYFKHHQRPWGETNRAEVPATLFGEPPVDEALVRLNELFVERVEARITEAVAAGLSFIVSDRMDLIFDDTIRGKAGDKHVRAAVKRLHNAGVIGGDAPVGVRMENYQITPGPAAPGR
jgi:three-Cys-motif partner protein